MKLKLVSHLDSSLNILNMTLLEGTVIHIPSFINVFNLFMYANLHLYKCMNAYEHHAMEKSFKKDFIFNFLDLF